MNLNWESRDWRRNQNSELEARASKEKQEEAARRESAVLAARVSRFELTSPTTTTRIEEQFAKIIIMETPQEARPTLGQRCKRHKQPNRKQQAIKVAKFLHLQGKTGTEFQESRRHDEHLLILANAATTTTTIRTKTMCINSKNNNNNDNRTEFKHHQEQKTQSRNDRRNSSPLTLLTLASLALLFVLQEVPELIEAQGQYQQHNNILHFVVPEGAPNNTYVGNIRSSDGQPPYLVLPAPQTPESERVAALTVNLANGDLHTNSILDREHRDQYHFVAIVKEPFAEIKCTVTVKDVNDNAPMFLLPNASEGNYVIELPEGQRGLREVLPLAIDFDSPQFGIKEFRIVSGNTPSGTFQLVEHEAPARSALQSNLLLGAEEPALSSASMGDDNPQLQQQFAQQATVLLPSQPQQVMQSLLGPTSAASTASGASGSPSSSAPASSSAAANIQQQAAGGPTTTTIITTSSQANAAQSKFLIDLEVNQVLDRENQSSYQLVVEAIDGGQPPNFGKLMVTVNVQDVNDNDPIFARKLYEVHFREDTAKGSLLLRVQAHDADLDLNAQISYFIKRHSSSSQQQSASSTNNSNSSDNIEVSTTNSNRYSSSNKRQATTAAAAASTSPSLGKPGVQQLQRSANQQQGNEIYDAEFAKSASQSSSSSSPPPPAGKSYQQQQDQLFEVDPVKGELYLSHQLDFETDQVHELVIEARDHGKPARSGYTLVKVYVIDVNDEPQPAAMSRLQMSELERLKQQQLVAQSAPSSAPSSEASRRGFNGELGASGNSPDQATGSLSFQNLNLAAWFAQINPAAMFSIVLFVVLFVAVSTCLVKSGSSQSCNNQHNKGGTMTSVGTHHSAVHQSNSPLPATPNTTHSSGLPAGALHDASHLTGNLVGGGHSHHVGIGPIGATIGSLGSLGTNGTHGNGGGGGNQHGLHHHHQPMQHHQQHLQHIQHLQQHHAHQHLNQLLPTLPPLRTSSSNSGAGPNHHHQQAPTANQLPPTPRNAPPSVFNWLQTPIGPSGGCTMGCFGQPATPGGGNGTGGHQCGAGAGGTMHSATCLGAGVGVHGSLGGGAGGGSALDHSGALPSPALGGLTQPLDRWFDLGTLSQLVYAHDWCGSYNWDYLADWTPDYQTMPLQVSSNAATRVATKIH